MEIEAPNYGLLALAVSFGYTVHSAKNTFLTPCLLYFAERTSSLSIHSRNCKVSSFSLAILKPYGLVQPSLSHSCSILSLINWVHLSAIPFRLQAAENKGCLFNVLIVSKNRAFIVCTCVGQTSILILRGVLVLVACKTPDLLLLPFITQGLLISLLHVVRNSDVRAEIHHKLLRWRFERSVSRGD